MSVKVAHHFFFLFRQCMGQEFELAEPAEYFIGLNRELQYTV